MHCIVLVKLLLKGWVIKINCDLCGKVDGQLNRTLIEGVELNVCSDCSKFGKVLAPVKRDSPKEQHRMMQKAESKGEKVKLLLEDYAEIIKKKREEMGLSQKDFGSKINEKESTIHHIETGTLEPSLSLAQKLERFLGVKLIEEHEEGHETVKKKSEGGFTLGDFIKVKK